MESLADKKKRWQAAMRSADLGPLIICSEVCEVINNWTAYMDQDPDAKSVAQWCKMTFSGRRGVAWWRGKLKALGYVGEAARRAIHHEVVTYIFNNVPEDKLDEVLKMLYAERYRVNAGNILTYEQATARIRQILGKAAIPRPACNECERLRGIISRLSASAFESTEVNAAPQVN